MNAITPSDTSDNHAASLRRCLSLLERHAPRLLLEHARGIQAAQGLVRRALRHGQAWHMPPPPAPPRKPGGRPADAKMQGAVDAWLAEHGTATGAPNGAIARHCAWHRINQWSFRTTLSRRRKHAAKEGAA